MENNTDKPNYVEMALDSEINRALKVGNTGICLFPVPTGAGKTTTIASKIIEWWKAGKTVVFITTLSANVNEDELSNQVQRF